MSSFEGALLTGNQGVYCVEKLGLDPEKVNPRGGAM